MKRNLIITVLNPLKPVLAWMGLMLTMFALLRCTLSLWQYQRVGSIDMLLELLWGGLRIDLQTLALPFLILSWISLLLGRSLSGQRLVFGLMAVFTAIAVFMEATTPLFIHQYDSRPNRLFFEYLIYPREVASLLFNGYLWVCILGTVSASFVTYCIVRLVPKFPSKMRYASVPLYATVSALAVVLIIAFAFGRGTADHRALNPASVAFADDALVNDIALNSVYSVGYALYGLSNEADMASKYGQLSSSDALSIVRKEMAVSESLFVNDTSTWHHQTASEHYLQPQNVVLILEESLGAEFVGYLGGGNLTPNLDKLSDEAWSLDNTYATGTRSVRGIEAVISGFPPTPSRAVVKRGNAQRDFYTVARSFEEHGYERMFLYGGDANFDKMRLYLANNGFNHIVEKDDFDNPTFVATWGASDGDLFDRLAHELDAAEQTQKPLFAFAFSSSNHSPFEIPEGKVEMIDGESAQQRAVRYADYALGEFFERAKHSSWWDNTVFLVVADHNSRTWGDSILPVDRFHIPALFIGQNIPSKHDNQLVSQLDLAPTLLSLAGISTTHPMIGYDLTKAAAPNRSLMQFNQTQGYRAGEQLAILQINQPASTWSLDEGKIERSGQLEMLEKTGLAHALFAEQAYQTKLWSQPETPHATPIVVRAASELQSR